MMTTQHLNLGVLLASGVPVLDPVSKDAAAISSLFGVVFLICLVILIVVVALICMSLFRSRSKAIDTPRQNFGSHRVEIGWTIPPVVIVLFLAVASARVIVGQNAAPAREVGSADAAADMRVVGHQWWWEVRYSGSAAVTANEIHIPVGRRLRVEVDSADVIHSFWVPQLGPKKDMIRGHPNFVWLQVDRAGVYEGACSEFCGDQHAWMRFTVVAEDEQSFQDWLAHHAKPASIPTAPTAKAGMDTFFAQTCANCHAIGGTTAVANAAPDLTHLASRRDLGAGVISNTPQNLAQWLRNPMRIKPGCQMPNFNFGDEQIDQLVAYLETLR
jgi:cytochrome c oxidase subunit 2